jgi:hypothetical protein
MSAHEVGKPFTCANCGETFDEGRSEEAANAEALEQFGVADASRDPTMAVVCHDCYLEIMVWLGSKALCDGGES